jgi:hypothetical protein
MACPEPNNSRWVVGSQSIGRRSIDIPRATRVPACQSPRADHLDLDQPLDLVIDLAFLSSTPHTILPLSFEVSTSHVSIEGSLDVETGSSGERERKRVLISDNVHDTRTPHQAQLAHPIIRSYRLAGSW